VLRIAALLLTLAMLAMAAPRPKDTAKEPVYFPTTEGTTLVYQVGESEETHVVTKVGEKGGAKIVHVDQIQPGGGMTPLQVVRVSEEGLSLVEEAGKAYYPEWLMLKMPAKPGDKWESKTARLGIGRIEESCTVGTPDKLTLPAGTFTAIPVTSTQTIGQGNMHQCIYWYVENIGVAKITMNGTTVRELKSVTVGGKK
jgi:hypothetical protein